MSNSNAKSPIGVFDSGVGGLSILNSLRLTLPNEDFVYFGDSANAPYGDKSADELTTLTQRIVQFLHSEHSIKFLVVACNSSSSVVPDYLSKFDNLSCLTPVDPVAEHIRKHDWWDDVGVLATRRTVDSNIYADKINALAPGVHIHQLACPGLVDLIEAGQADAPECRELAHSFAAQLSQQCEDMDAVILGCTHYPLVAHHIRTEFLPKTNLLNPAGLLADATYDWLSERELLNNGVSKGSITCYTSGDPETFAQTVRQLSLPHLGPIKPLAAD